MTFRHERWGYMIDIVSGHERILPAGRRGYEHVCPSSRLSECVGKSFCHSGEMLETPRQCVRKQYPETSLIGVWWTRMWSPVWMKRQEWKGIFPVLPLWCLFASTGFKFCCQTLQNLNWWKKKISIKARVYAADTAKKEQVTRSSSCQSFGLRWINPSDGNLTLEVAASSRRLIASAVTQKCVRLTSGMEQMFFFLLSPKMPITCLHEYNLREQRKMPITQSPTKYG